MACGLDRPGLMSGDTCLGPAIIAAVPTAGSGDLTCAPKEQEKKTFEEIFRHVEKNACSDSVE